MVPPPPDCFLHNPLTSNSLRENCFFSTPLKLNSFTQTLLSGYAAGCEARLCLAG